MPHSYWLGTLTYGMCCLLVGTVVGQEPESPRPTVDQVISAAIRSADGIELLRQLPADLPEDAVAKLRNLDRSLAGRQSPEIRGLTAEILTTLARTGSPRSLSYLHEIFESNPSRRSDVAVAIARFAMVHRRRPEDWRLLVRSLPIVEPAHSVEVLRSLHAFAERGTKPEWQRQVILVGLRGDEPTAEAAIQLLGHWSGRKTRHPDDPIVDLPGWQKWFSETHPDQPPPQLPVDLPTANYKRPDILNLLGAATSETARITAGAEVYHKAQCIKCHRFGDRGEPMGPDLTSVRQRFQVGEVIDAILYPAHQIPEEYASTIVTTRDGRTLTGVVAAAGNRVLILQANGEKVAFGREEIESTESSNVSAMPAGLLDPLTPVEIADLFAYLFAKPAE